MRHYARRNWTAQEDALLIELREKRNLQWRAIAPYLPGRSHEQCAAHYNKMPGRCQNKLVGKRVKSAPGERATFIHKLSVRQEAEREARAIGYDARDLTQTFFGDPPRGFSALDSRGQR